MASDPLSPAVARGRALFTTERDRRISRDGRACAACHPEGRDDGLVWKLGVGPRQTPTLIGRLGSGPFGWDAKHAKLERSLEETIPRLGGTGLPAAELRDLTAFLQSELLGGPDAGGDRLAAGAGDAAVRGKAIFESERTGCAGCHALDREGSDRAAHVVGSRGKDDARDAYRTPPLLFVGATAPYFHDGRYATLEALLADNLDRMGQTSHLSREELGDPAAFLRSL